MAFSGVPSRGSTVGWWDERKLARLGVVLIFVCSFGIWQSKTTFLSKIHQNCICNCNAVASLM